MYNPINQNSMHFKILKNFLGLKNDYFRNIIVFGDLAKITSYKNMPYYAQVCFLENLITSIKKMGKRFNTTIEEHMIQSIYNSLEPLVRKTDEREQQHINNRLNIDKFFK